MHNSLPQTTTPSLAAQAMTRHVIGRSLRPFRRQPAPISPNQIYFDHNVPFENTTPIYLINLPQKLGL